MKPTVGEVTKKAGWKARWGIIGEGRRKKGKTVERKKKGRAERKEAKQKGDYPWTGREGDKHNNGNKTKHKPTKKSENECSI